MSFQVKVPHATERERGASEDLLLILGDVCLKTLRGEVRLETLRFRV